MLEYVVCSLNFIAYSELAAVVKLLRSMHTQARVFAQQWRQRY